MAYTPINWATGDTITADKLNRCDNGWGVGGGSRTLILEETVTTEGAGPALAALAYSSEITVPAIVVTLNGTEYECAYDAEIFGYGDRYFQTYPFVIDQYNGYPELATPEAGTYSLKVETAAAQTIEVSQGFVNAVAFHATVGTTTFQEIDDALAAGRLVVVSDSGSFGSACQLVCSADKTSVPLHVNAVNVTSNGVSANSYLAASASSPIMAN